MRSCIVVGCGGISNAWFKPLKAENVDIVAVVDLDRGRAEAKIEQHELTGAVAYDSLTQALAERECDFVVDVTVPEAHCAVTCEALAAGRHVIGEKPMASTLDEARQMLAAAARSGKNYSVSQSRRWVPHVLAITKAIADGRIGKLTTVHCDFMLRCVFEGFRAEMDHALLGDMTIHHVDLARKMSNVDPTGVYASAFNPADSWARHGVAADAIFDMTNDVRFTYRGSWCSKGKQTSWHGNWRFTGTEGCILWEYDQTPVLCLPKPEAQGNQREATEQPLDCPKPEVGGQHMALRQLLAHLDGGPEPEGTCTDNIKSFAMCTEAIVSSDTGVKVAIEV